MKEVVMNKKVSSEKVVQDIRRKTRKKYSSEEKIPIWKKLENIYPTCFRKCPLLAVCRLS
jgi:hypothetical protein